MEIEVGLPPKCTWTPGMDMADCPHYRNTNWERNDKILGSALEAIGNTPLIKLNKIPQSYGIKCDILAKCEYMNPGGSVKDRVGIRMLEEGEDAGKIKPGTTRVIVPTSGNTGIGVAFACALKGYDCTIVMSEKMSKEKEYVILALGADVIRTPASASAFAPEGTFGVSYKLQSEDSKNWVADQYTCPGNPMVHFDTTAEELVFQCDGEIAMFVAATGTGATLTGVSRRLREVMPDAIIVGADPIGSKMARPKSLNETDVTFFEVEGVGHEFEPTVLNYDCVDEWIKVGDKDAHVMARRLIKEEGLFCGASSGTAMTAAIEAAQRLGPGQKCVVIIPDSIRNYLTKFVDDHWMESRGFYTPVNDKLLWWYDECIASLRLKEPPTAFNDDTIHRVFHLMKKNETDYIVVVNRKDGGILGVAIKRELIRKIVGATNTEKDKIEDSAQRIYPKAIPCASLGLISRILEVEEFVVIQKKVGLVQKPMALVTPMDLLQFTATRANSCC